MCLHDRLVLPADGRAPAVGRRFVGERLRDWGFADAGAADDAMLVTSELVTNAVVHGCGPVELRLCAHRTCLEIDIEDADPRVPALRPPGGAADAAADSGRGLDIVHGLAEHLAVEARPDGSGKAVRVRLRLPAPVELAGCRLSAAHA